MQTLYHGSRVVVEQPEIRIQKFHKDFYWGFYCTSYEQQALRWATRFGKAGVVNVYSFDLLRHAGMEFPMTMMWWKARWRTIPSSIMCRAFWMVRSPELLSGNWQNSSIPPIRSASTLHVLSLH